MARRARKIEKLTIVKKTIDGEAGWWIHDPNNDDVAYSGPYTTKKEAQPDKTGLEYFWRYLWDDN